MTWRDTLAIWVERLSIWHGYEDALQTLAIYAVGIAIYTVLVFTFYQNIAKRNAFTLKHRPGKFGSFLSFLESSIAFPVMSFAYFGVLAVSLFVLAKSQATVAIVLLAMSVVVSVRVCAFVSELAAVDLAKMLPLALLGVLIVDPSYASLATTWGRLLEVPSLVPLLWRSFVFFIVLELVLRTARHTLTKVFTGKKARLPLKKKDLIEDASR